MEQDLLSNIEKQINHTLHSSRFWSSGYSIRNNRLNGLYLRSENSEDRKIKKIPDIIVEAIYLETISFGINLIETIPENFGQLQRLRYCFLGNNLIAVSYTHLTLPTNREV